MFRPNDPWQAVVIWTVAQVLITPYAMWVNARALRVSMVRPLSGGLMFRASK